MGKPDPTKDADFQHVVQHFLKTPPKPFTPKAQEKTSPKKNKGKSDSKPRK